MKKAEKHAHTPNPFRKLFESEERFAAVSSSAAANKQITKVHTINWIHWAHRPMKRVGRKVAWWIFKELIPDTAIVCGQTKCVAIERQRYLYIHFSRSTFFFIRCLLHNTAPVRPYESKSDKWKVKYTNLIGFSASTTAMWSHRTENAKRARKKKNRLIAFELLLLWSSFECDKHFCCCTNWLPYFRINVESLAKKKSHNNLMVLNLHQLSRPGKYYVFRHFFYFWKL